MRSNCLGRSLGVLFLLACVSALAGCGGFGIFGGSDVSCDELTSSKWKSLENGERKAEAEAIQDCGTVDGMTRAEVITWMGKPIERSFNVHTKNKIDSWLIGSSPNNSDLPMISVEYGKDGRVTDVSIFTG